MAKVTRQGIVSIAKYLIIVLVLATLVVALALFINQRGDQARHNQAVETTTQDEGGTNTEQIAIDDQTESSTNQTSSQAGTTSEASSAEELPTTGLEISIVNLLALAMLTMATTSFVMSRRAARQLL